MSSIIAECAWLRGRPEWGRKWRINFKEHRVAPEQPHVVVVKLDPRIRKKPPTIVCSFCPFCGKKYPEDEE